MGYYTLNCGSIGKGRTTNTGVLNLDRSRMTPGYVHYGLQLHLFAGDSNSYPGSGTTWYDLSGNGRHGEIEGNPTYTATPGYFDITSDNTYVDIPNDGLSPGVGDYTYSMWIKFDSFNSGDEIFSNGRYSSTGIQVRTSADRLFLYHDGDSAGYFDTGGVTDGEWVNFVFVRENGVGKFYYDGALRDTLTGTAMSKSINISSSYSDLRLMRSVRYNNDNVDGKIAQFSVYDRALSLEEVIKNYGYFGGRIMSPPVLTSSAPANGSTNYPGNFAITLGFSSQLFIGNGNVVIKNSSDNSIFETISVTSNQVTGNGTSLISIQPSSTLVDGTQYYINIDATAFSNYPGISDTTTLSFTAAAAATGHVTTDLALHLDAYNTSSYSGSGNTWTDLSGNSNNATRTSSSEVVYNSNGWFDWTDGPGYDSTQGCFTLPNDSFTLGANFTIEVWNYYDSTSAPNTSPWTGGNLWTNSANSDWNGGAGSNNGLLFGYNSMRYRNTSNSETQLTYSSNPTTQVWHQHVLVVDSGTATVYVDKNSVGTASDIRTYTQSNGDLGIGIADKFGSNFRGEYLGFISIVRIYQKSLTALEILQNYNAHKGRYGL